MSWHIGDMPVLAAVLSLAVVRPAYFLPLLGVVSPAVLVSGKSLSGPAHD
jgi:hypothetical protein